MESVAAPDGGIGTGAPTATAGERRRFWKPLFRRSIFFAQAILETILDGIYLLAVYFWTVAVNAGANHFHGVEGLERLALDAARYTFVVAPVAAAVWFAVIDLMGVLRRIWEKRNDR